MNKGYIYKITNLINDKMYIGQTSKTVEERYREHISNSKRTKSKNYPIYRAFNKYGINNFKLETLCECDISELDEKEIYYIKKFNTYCNGYNATLGGGGHRSLQINERKIIKDYIKIQNITIISKKYNISNSTTREILKKYKVKILSSEFHAKSKGFLVYRIDKETKQILETYNTLHEAGQWLIDNNLTNSKKNTQSYIKIKKAIIMNNLSSGYYWDSPNYTIQDKVIIKLIRVTSFYQLGKEYGVRDNIIRKWCKSYNLPYKRSEINKIDDKEWELI